MGRDEAFDTIKKDLIDIFEIEADTIQAEAKLMDDLGLDSIDGVDMMVRLQERIGQKITPEQFENVQTVDDIVELVVTMTK
jgi:acyl carrier protein